MQRENSNDTQSRKITTGGSLQNGAQTQVDTVCDAIGHKVRPGQVVQGPSFTCVRPKRKGREISAHAKLIQHVDVGPKVVHVVVERQRILGILFQVFQRHFAR